MKKRICIVMYIAILFWLFTISYGHCANVTFEWDANAPEEQVTNYKLHLGNATRNYIKSVDAGNVTQFTVTDLADGKWYAAATAHDAAGNSSDFSNEVEFSIDTTAPRGVQNFRFKSVSKGD